MELNYDCGSTSSSKKRRKRAPRMTMAQASYLANFMLRNKEFAMRNPTTEEGEKKKREAWKRLAMELNSLSGSSKKVEGWKKAWLDLKRTSRLRVTKILKDKGPGVDIDKCNISDLDRRVLEAVGIAIKVGDDTCDIGNDDEELTFVEVKESDDSCDFLGADGNEDPSLEVEYNQDDDTGQYDVKDSSLTNVQGAQESGQYVPRRKYKQSSSCTDQSDGSNYSDESGSEDKKQTRSKRKGKKLKAAKKRKSDEVMIERVLRDLQDDYTSGLKAIAEAVNKIGENRRNHYQPKPKRKSEPWFHYLKFDN